MKTLILWLGAFGFPMVNHLAKNNPNIQFYGYERADDIRSTLKSTRHHPFFFTDIALAPNIEIIDDPKTLLPSVELLILAMPNQFIRSSMIEIQNFLRPWVVILNLSKGIDNHTLMTVSETLGEVLDTKTYHYAVLSGGMIASELMDGKMLGADIGVWDATVGNTLKKMFQSDMLDINIISDYKSVELFGAMKNIFALFMGYLEGSWCGMSTIGYHFVRLYRDMSLLIEKLWNGTLLDFGSFSLGGDLIATCFGDSRNRAFGRMVGEGKTPIEAYEILKEKKKHAEWYETLKGIKKYIGEGDDFPELKKVINIFLT